MNIPFFNSNKLSKFQIQNILLTAKELSRSGIPFVEALQIISEEKSSGKKVRDTLLAVVNDIKVKGRKAEEVLFVHNLIGYLEFVILKYSDDIKDSLDDIIEIQSKGNMFEGMVVSIFTLPLMLVLGAMGIMYLAQPNIYEYVTFMSDMAQAFGKSNMLENVSIPFYVESRETTLMVIGGIVGLVAFLILLYKYLYHRHVFLIYRLFPLKTYDDAYFLFGLMSKLSRAGVSTQNVIDEVYTYARPESLKPMLSEIKRRIENNKPFYIVMENYGFPSDITSIISTGERTENLWENINSLLQYLQNARDEKIKFYKNLLSPPFKFAGFAVVIFTFIQVFLLLISLSMELSSI